MHNLIERIYSSYFRNNGLHRVKSSQQRPGYSFNLDNDLGEGQYWVYPVKNHFVVTTYNLQYITKNSTRNQKPISTALGACTTSNTKDWFGGVQDNRKQLLSFSSDGGTYDLKVAPGDYINSTAIVFTSEYYKERIEPITRQSYDAFTKIVEFLNGTHELLEVLQLLDSLAYLPYQSSYIDVLLEGKLISIIGAVLDGLESYEHPKTQQSNCRLDSHQLAQVRSYIDNHFNEKIRLEKLTQIACMSKSKLLQLFKDYNGITITSYIRKQRIITAKKLLATTDDALSIIADQVGYGRQSSFSEAFRTMEGITPSRFRYIIKTRQ